MTELKHIGRIKISGTLKALTGLHVGGTSVGLEIGGADNTIVRNGLDGRPYIPGSSLKGKMRCLLARVYTPGQLEEQRGSHFPRLFKLTRKEEYEDPSKSFLFHIFGVTPEEIRKLGGESLPTRLIVRDAMMTDETAEALERSLYTDMPMTQVKTEVVIDRITSQANPRQMERVPAGAEFTYELVFNVFFESDLTFLPYVAEAMELLENDYLGGQGSRGYGQVRFETRHVDVVSFNGTELASNDQVVKFKETVERGA